MNLKKPVFWDDPKQSIISNLLIPFTLPIILRNFFTKFIKKKNRQKLKQYVLEIFILEEQAKHH